VVDLQKLAHSKLDVSSKKDNERNDNNPGCDIDTGLNERAHSCHKTDISA
jgi:hypothetical protein